MYASAKDLRFYTKKLLDAVSRGEEVIITYRGKPCAKLTPLKEIDKPESQTDPLFGLWKDHAHTKPKFRGICALSAKKRYFQKVARRNYSRLQLRRRL